MIQSTELRIGNWVSFKGLWNERVRSISSSGMIQFVDNDGIFDEEGVEPISVTKEILYKLGATDFPDGEHLTLCNRLIGYAECRNEFFDSSTGLPLKYLHQLQNLYFALTGQELNYKP